MDNETMKKAALYIAGCAEVEARANLGFAPMLVEVYEIVNKLAAGTHVICRAEPVLYAELKPPLTFRGKMPFALRQIPLYAQDEIDRGTK